MNIKHVIWDWNGTLLNDRWLCVEGINAGLEKRGLPMITEKMYKEVFSFPVKEYYKKVGFDFSKEEFEIAGDEFVKFYGESFHKAKLHPKVPQVIKDIKNVGLTQSILSAGKQEYLNEWVKSHQLSNYFSVIRGVSNHYARGKIELGISFINELSYQKNEVIMIGDTIHDSEVAEAMGINCILLDHGHISHNRLVKTGRKVLSDITQILEVLGY